jgi:hypothetical protein
VKWRHVFVFWLLLAQTLLLLLIAVWVEAMHVKVVQP